MSATVLGRERARWRLAMKSPRKEWSALGAAVLLGLFAVRADAALRYVTDIEIVKNDRTTHQVEKATFDGDRARIEFFEGKEGSAKPMGFMLTVDGGKTWVLSDGPNTECGELDMEAFFRKAGSLVAKAERWTNAKVTKANVETLSREPGPEMLGYATTRVRLLSTLHAKARVLFLKYEYHLEIADEFLFGPDVELHKIEKRYLDALAHTGYDKLDRMSQSTLSEIGGAVLKQNTLVRLRNVRKDEEKTWSEKYTVKSLENLAASELPEGLFDVPKCEPVDEDSMEARVKALLKY